MDASVTAFGASWETDPRVAGAVLRAQASTAVTLAHVSTDDMVASVVAAHLWAATLGETSLANSHRHPAGAAFAAAAVLARAAGHRTGPALRQVHEILGRVSDAAPVPRHVVANTAAALRWARNHCEHDSSYAYVLRAAGVDLMDAGEGHLAMLGWMLVTESCEHEDPDVESSECPSEAGPASGPAPGLFAG